MPLSRGAAELLARLTFHSQLRGYAWPSQRYLADKMNAGVRSVKRWTAELRAAGLIECTRLRQQNQRYEIKKGQNGPSFGPCFGPSHLIRQVDNNTNQGNPTMRKPNRREYRAQTDARPLCQVCGKRHGPALGDHAPTEEEMRLYRAAGGAL